MITMIGCDNPACRNTDHPEEGGTKTKPRPPYGWLTLKGGWYGSGPYFDIVVCSTDCVVAAMIAIEEET